HLWPTRATVNPSLVDLDIAAKRPRVVGHQLVANLVEHAPGGLVVDPKLALKLFGRDAAASARHQVHRVKPQAQRSRGAVEDRPGRGMDVVPAGGAGPRLALLSGRVALEGAPAVAARAVGVLAVRREPGPPQMLQASGIVGEVPQEL